MKTINPPAYDHGGYEVNSDTFSSFTTASGSVHWLLLEFCSVGSSLTTISPRHTRMKWLIWSYFDYCNIPPGFTIHHNKPSLLLKQVLFPFKDAHHRNTAASIYWKHSAWKRERQREREWERESFPDKGFGGPPAAGDQVQTQCFKCSQSADDKLY